METIIKLDSRGDTNTFLKKLKSTQEDKESKTYLLKTNTAQFRVGYTEDANKYIDPVGGPMIVQNTFLPEAKALVKSIDLVVGYGYTITFE